MSHATTTVDGHTVTITGPDAQAIIAELTAQRAHFQALAQDNGATIIKTACELADVKARLKELLEVTESLLNGAEAAIHAKAVGPHWWHHGLAKARALITKHQPPAAPAASTP